MAVGTVRSCRCCQNHLIDPPREFQVTWEAMGAISWLAVELCEVADGTQVELRHTQHSDHDFWRQYGPGATGVGWDLSLIGLGLHLAGAAQLDRSVFRGDRFRFVAVSSLDS